MKNKQASCAVGKALDGIPPSSVINQERTQQISKGGGVLKHPRSRTQGVDPKNFGGGMKF